MVCYCVETPKVVLGQIQQMGDMAPAWAAGEQRVIWWVIICLVS
jgi:hypothetical protein